MITGASDDDPAGIATYSVAGAAFGFSTLWLALITLPLMSSVQFMAAKLGMVTGQGMAAAMSRVLPRPVLIVGVLALVAPNALNAGADIGAIAAAIDLIVQMSRHVGGRRMLTHVSEVEALGDDGKYRLRDIFTVQPDPNDKKNVQLTWTGQRSTFAENLRPHERSLVTERTQHIFELT